VSPDPRLCEACRTAVADDAEIPELCWFCAANIDVDYERTRDERDLERFVWGAGDVEIRS
jgi:hypothetical protein